MDKPKVGQRVYALNIGNSARFRPQVLTERIVATVGRKYFTLEKFPRTKFDNDTWREVSEYSADTQLYASPEAWENEKERSDILKMLCNAFNGYAGIIQREISLVELRQISAIVSPIYSKFTK